MPPVSEFHDQVLNLAGLRCVGRRINGEGDRRFSPMVFHAKQCANDAVERCAIERATMPPPPITAMVLGDLRMAVCAAHRPRRPISGHSLWGVSRADIGSGGGLFAHFSAPSDMDFTPLLAHALQCEGVSPLRFEVILEAHHLQTDDAAAEPLWTTGKGQCPERFTFYRMRPAYLKATG